MYDISDSESFNKLDYWIEEIRANSQEISKMIIVGNKCDLNQERQVKKEEGTHEDDNWTNPFSVLSFEEIDFLYDNGLFSKGLA